MDHGQSLIIPPLFDGTSYAYWKVCMRTFLQSLDEKVWLAIEVGLTKPAEAFVTWDDEKINDENFNRRALCGRPPKNRISWGFIAHWVPGNVTLCVHVFLG